VWGALHGIFLVVHHAWVWARARVGSARAEGAEGSLPGRVAATALTLACVVLAWVFFRATDLPSAFRMLASLFGRADVVYLPPDPAGHYWPWIAIACAIALFGRNSQQLIDGTLSNWLAQRPEPAGLLDVRLLLVGALAVVIVLLAIVAASRTVAEFIYFNF
jgi:alginate O-acetyltransferase complex protein AlgI